MCNVNNDSSQEISWSRWVAGGIGSILVVNAVAFAILGLVQPDWLTSHIGIAGDPHSWELWTIAGGACLAGGCLIAYAIFVGKAANNRDSSASKGLPEGKVDVPSQLRTEAEEFAGITLKTYPEETGEGKVEIPSKLRREGEEFAEITLKAYPKEIGYIAQIKKELMTEPVMKTRFKDKSGWRKQGVECIILRVKCVSNPETLQKEAAESIESIRLRIEEILKMNHPYLTQAGIDATIQNMIKRHEEKLKLKPALLNLFKIKTKWQQHHIHFKGKQKSKLEPAFIERWESGGFGPGLHNPGVVDDKYIQMQEEGLSRLKRLMQGEVVTDLRGHKWQLDDS